MAKQTSSGSQSAQGSARSKKSRTSTSSAKTSKSAPAKNAKNDSMNTNSASATAQMPTSDGTTPGMMSHSSNEDRERMIQYAAYHIAERDGFQSGKEQEYWLRAEQQIDDLLKGRKESNQNSDVH